MSIHPQQHIIFQSTLPRGERHICSIMFSSSGSFQSTLPRGERQFVLSILLNCCEFQSMLPRGERRKTGNTSGRFVGFQSTLPRGERLCLARNLFNPFCRFQSTLPRGERLSKLSTSSSDVVISIHAPARGATNAYYWVLITKLAFQSTLPRGERQSGRTRAGSNTGNFNPRSREGSDGAETPY